MKLIRYKYPQALANSAYKSLFTSATPAVSRFESLFDDFFGAAGEQNQVPADLFEGENHFYARLELPGVKKDEIELKLENAILTIRGAEVGEGDVLRGCFNFKHSIAVPDGVAVDQISASHEDGLLTVTMPKLAVRKPRQIEVK